MRRALVIGYGSIGTRHANVLSSMGLKVSVVSRHGNIAGSFDAHGTIADAARAGPLDYAVVATETARHAEDLAALIATGYAGMILVEKPLFGRSMAWAERCDAIYVGYQLRFHPAVARLRAFVGGRACVAAEFYVGQHLDRWRATDARHDSYAKFAGRGGGVLRDLSHELDLAQFLFGKCLAVTAIGGKFANVTVDSDDTWGILAKFERCAIVTFQLNYLDRTPRRHVVVVTESDSAVADLTSGAFTSNGQSAVLDGERDAVIGAMHRSLLDEDGKDACDFAAGLRTVGLIDAIERASRSQSWVEP